MKEGGSMNQGREKGQPEVCTGDGSKPDCLGRRLRSRGRSSGQKALDISANQCPLKGGNSPGEPQ